MRFSLIICTYKRPEALTRLLYSVRNQELQPNEILVIDGSPDAKTLEAVSSIDFPSLRYFQVKENDRGLTRQRNFGISKVEIDSKVVCFLDDDIVLESNFFKNLMETYQIRPDAVGVGGYIIEEIEWHKNITPAFEDFEMDGYVRKLGSRNVLRKRLGLLSDKPPGIMPAFSNGFSTGFLPPSGKVYPVEYFMGGVASYKKELFEKISFSSYFEGYGLYEDMDFCLKAFDFGQLYVNTAARLYHLHDELGRPNNFAYGKMVIRNGWYVWRVKYPRPKFRANLKWHGTALLLTIVRIGNIFTTNKKRKALTESLGRIAGWWSLFFNKPLKGNKFRDS